MKHSAKRLRTLVQIWASAPLRAATERAADDAGLSMSSFLREILVVELTKRGYYPPPGPSAVSETP